MPQFDRPISARSVSIYIYIHARSHCCTRETRVEKVSIRGWDTTMKDCRISRRARPFVGFPLVGALYAHSSLSRLSAYRPSNMRISRRKLQLSLKSYATGAGVTTRICDLTGADWIVHSADAKLLERDGSHRLPSFETIDYELLSSYPACSSILLHIYIYMCVRKILFHSFPFVSLRFWKRNTWK